MHKTFVVQLCIATVIAQKNDCQTGYEQYSPGWLHAWANCTSTQPGCSFAAALSCDGTLQGSQPGAYVSGFYQKTGVAISPGAAVGNCPRANASIIFACGVSAALSKGTGDSHGNSSLPRHIWARQHPMEPVDMPTANPYVSQKGKSFYPIGSQNGMILPSSYDHLWDSANGKPYPSSNNYTAAVEQCSATCDSDSTCLLFNVLTVAESDFNSGIPTWECRFSKQPYDPKDFSTSNGLPSYVWARQPPLDPVDMPTANPYISKEGNPFYSLGSQNGMILPSTFTRYWKSEGGNYPSSNNYTAAIEQCTAACDSDPTCALFNLFTAAETDFNLGIPTWECRFSSTTYDPKDYTEDNSPRPSYVWAREPYVPSPASGAAIVVNSCAFNVTLWSVGNNISLPHTLQQGEYYDEVMTIDPVTGGRALKITRESNGIYDQDNQTVFSYELTSGLVSYALSDVYGDAFSGHKVVEAPSDASCPPIVWANGTPQQPSYGVCQNATDITLTLCAY